MNKMICQAIAVLLAIVSIAANAASELQNYVQQCETELQFNASDVPALNCNNGVLFAGGGPRSSLINDYFIYARVNDTVDLAVACRWLNNNSGPSTLAGSVELLIHNRQTGSTCFFSAIGTNANSIQPVPVAIVSPTNFSATHPNADDYWVQPTDLNSLRLPSDQNMQIQPNFPVASSFTDPVQCVGCHSQGPFIASQDIVPFLAQFGLLNNGHPTLIDMTAPQHYHAVGASGYNKPVITAFQNWDSIIASNNIPNGCSAGCHSLAANSTIGTLFTIPGGIDRLLPSIQSDIVSLENSGVMPPFDDTSNYHWVNLDTPTNSTPSAGVESENFSDAINRVANSIIPVLFHGFDPNNPTVPSNPNCTQAGNNVPSALEAHVVGVPADFAFSTVQMAQLPDRLNTFNLKEGLTCLNSDQESGQSCHDYAIRYLCSISFEPNATVTPTWSGLYNTDSPNNDGDHEERSRDQDICGGATPIAIQAQVSVNGNTISVMGPNDRLARFSPYGLTCNNSDQIDGQCSNYVVRYDTCTAPPFQYLARITAAWSNVELTATGTANNAIAKGQPYTPSWNTQQWMIEPVLNTEYVRIRDTGTNTYLNVTTQSEAATVVTYASNTGYTSEEWTIEPVPQSDLVRFKNLWSGKYLTLGDTSTYSAIYSQGLNTTWASQKWSIN